MKWTLLLLATVSAAPSFGNTFPPLHGSLSLSPQTSKALWDNLKAEPERDKKPKDYKEPELANSLPHFLLKRVPDAGIECWEVKQFREQANGEETTYLCTISLGQKLF